MYSDLSALLSASSSTRAYFVSLPVWLQVMLHEKHDCIHTAMQLHRAAEILLEQKHLLL